MVAAAVTELAIATPTPARRRRRRATPIGERITRLALSGVMLGGLLGVPSAYSLLATPGPALDAADMASGGIIDAPAVADGAAGPKEIVRARDGMFYTSVTINGAKLRCLIDTGASAIVLDAADDSLGLGDLARHPNGRILTAGGARPATRTRVASLTVAGHSFRQVPAIVVRGGATPCLLGQDMLARLDAVELHGDRLVMR